jgi:hypothetical protein
MVSVRVEIRTRNIPIVKQVCFALARRMQFRRPILCRFEPRFDILSAQHWTKSKSKWNKKNTEVKALILQKAHEWGQALLYSQSNITESFIRMKTAISPNQQTGLGNFPTAISKSPSCSRIFRHYSIFEGASLVDKRSYGQTDFSGSITAAYTQSCIRDNWYKKWAVVFCFCRDLKLIVKKRNL